jgi:hypothetical protein
LFEEEVPDLKPTLGLHPGPPICSQARALRIPSYLELRVAGEDAIAQGVSKAQAIWIRIVFVGIDQSLVESAGEVGDVLGGELGDAAAKGLKALLPLGIQSRKFPARPLDVAGAKTDVYLCLAKDFRRSSGTALRE